MIYCNIQKEYNGTFSINEGLLSHNHLGAIFQISEDKFNELKTSKNQKELTFLYILHSGAL